MGRKRLTNFNLEMIFMGIFTPQYVIFALLVYYLVKVSRHDGVFLELIEAETIILAAKKLLMRALAKI